MDIKIRQITALETYPVRHPVLRAGRPLEDCAFSGDDVETTIHLGAFVNGELAAVTSLMKNSDATFKEFNHLMNDNAYQLRGMAVLENRQGHGLGKKLLLRAEEIMKQKNVSLLWFNARINAVPFYEKLDYHIEGKSFEIPLIGVHYKMYKEL